MNFKAENKRIAGLIKAGLEKLELGDVGAAFLDFESALLFDDENFAAIPSQPSALQDLIGRLRLSLLHSRQSPLRLASRFHTWLQPKYWRPSIGTPKQNFSYLKQSQKNRTTWCFGLSWRGF